MFCIVRNKPILGQSGATLKVAKSLVEVWKRFDIDTISLWSIQSRVKTILNKYKTSKKSCKKSAINFHKILDIKKAGFKFLTKEDELLYQQQINTREGSTTRELIEFKQHPSKVRKTDQFSSIRFSSPSTATMVDDDVIDTTSSVSSDEEQEIKRYSKAKAIGVAVNKSQLAANKAATFLKIVAQENENLVSTTPSTSGIYKVFLYFGFTFSL